MPGTADVLRELHRLARHVKNLQDELNRLPRLRQLQQTKVTRQEEVLKQTQDKITKLKLASRDKEKTLKATHDQISKYQKQLDTVATKKEMDALQIEIAHAQESCRKLEDETLAILEEIDQLTAKVPELEKALQETRTEWANWDQTQQQQQANLRTELDRTRTELKEAEANLPADIRQQYHRLVAAKGEDALSAVQGRTCLACYTEITAQMHHDLRTGSFVLCKNCGRILYLAEEAS